MIRSVYFILTYTSVADIIKHYNHYIAHYNDHGGLLMIEHTSVGELILTRFFA